MECTIVGYFSDLKVPAKQSKRAKKNREKILVLVNLEHESMKKLRNLHKTLYPNFPGMARSPVMKNGANIKCNWQSFAYDVDGKPTVTEKLKGQQIVAKCKINRYCFGDEIEKIYGWNMQLLEAQPYRHP